MIYLVISVLAVSSIICIICFILSLCTCIRFKTKLSVKERWAGLLACCRLPSLKLRNCELLILKAHTLFTRYAQCLSFLHVTIALWPFLQDLLLMCAASWYSTTFAVLWNGVRELAAHFESLGKGTSSTCHVIHSCIPFRFCLCCLY